MAENTYSAFERPHLAGVESLRHRWGWFLALGIALIILGMIAIGAAIPATFLTIAFLGWLLLIGGVAQMFSAVFSHHGSGFFMHLLAGILYLIVGVLIVANPAAGAITLTLLLAAFFMFEGVFRIVSAASMRFPRWGWAVASGIITLLLGLMIWAQWPLSGLWVIGMFVGIDMIIYGWSLVMLTMAIRGLGRPAATIHGEPRTV